MKSYQNLGGDSGIVAYDYDSQTIKVKFHDGAVYEYKSSVIGLYNFRQMIVLAESGHGLHSFIMRNREIRKGFSNKYIA